MEDFHPTISDDGDGVVITALISVAREDGKPDGPSVRVQLLAPLRHEISFRFARLAAIDRVLQLLRRVGSETPESINEQWEMNCREAIESEKNRISLGGGVSLSVGESESQ